MQSSQQYSVHVVDCIELQFSTVKTAVFSIQYMLLTVLNCSSVQSRQQYSVHVVDCIELQFSTVKIAVFNSQYMLLTIELQFSTVKTAVFSIQYMLLTVLNCSSMQSRQQYSS